MEGEKRQRTFKEFWALVRRQHGVVTRQQLLAHGRSPKWIEHRLARGRLHRAHDGIYAVGRPALTQHGRWMAAVLTCGPKAVISHESAAALWTIRPQRNNRIDVSLPCDTGRKTRRGIVVHRRPTLTEGDVTRREGIPVTTPVCTLVDLGARLDPRPLEAAVNEADKLGLTDPEKLRAALTGPGRRPGVRQLRELLDRRTFVLTDSELERLLLPLAREAGLSGPVTGAIVGGFKVDFYWPDLGLIVETDGLRYHRTPAQQARDRVRDQTHAAMGLTPLRFTHAHVRFEPERVRQTLAAVAKQLAAGTR